MRSGPLRHKVSIQEPIESKGAMGGTIKQWVTFHKCWAEVREMSGRELVNSDHVTSEIKAAAFIRYKSHIDASMRLVHGDNVYQIESVINKDGKKSMLELLLYEFR